MTAFKQAISICGMSQRDAADFLSVSIGTIKSWSSGRNNVPDGVWHELAVLYDRMDECAESAIALINEHQPDAVEFSYSGEHGKWPSVGTSDAVEAMVRLRLNLT